MTKNANSVMYKNTHMMFILSTNILHVVSESLTICKSSKNTYLYTSCVPFSFEILLYDSVKLLYHTDNDHVCIQTYIISIRTDCPKMFHSGNITPQVTSICSFLDKTIIQIYNTCIWTDLYVYMTQKCFNFASYKYTIYSTWKVHHI